MSVSAPRIAAAPISWGVCEVEGWGTVLEPETVLAEMARLGVRATELGPPKYLPDVAPDLNEVLSEYRLELAGGFVPVVLHDAERADEAVAAALESAELLAAVGSDVLVLAAATGLSGYDDKPVLAENEWRTLVDTAARVRDAAAAVGVRAVLHPHIGTHVEDAIEVARFIADSDLPLCLDTGHLMIGGTDPVGLARRHPDRVGHVHLKDVDNDIAEQVRQGRLTYTHAVANGLYVPLGSGDVDIRAMVRAVHDWGYEGWYVLEQDTALTESSSLDQPSADTAASLSYLADVFELPAVPN